MSAGAKGARSSEGGREEEAIAASVRRTSWAAAEWGEGAPWTRSGRGEDEADDVEMEGEEG